MIHYTYTYEGGRKLSLSRLTSRFVSRADRAQLIRDDFRPIQPLSRHSWSVSTNEDRIDEDIQRARQLAPAYPYYLVAESGSDYFVTDRLFLRLRGGAAFDELAAKHQLQLLKSFSYRDYLVRVDPRADVVALVRRLTEDESDIDTVDHDLNVRPEHHAINIDKSLTRKQWYLFSSTTHPLVSKEALVDCQGAWAKAGFGSREVVVGVIDCGCDLKDVNFDENTFAGWAVLIDGQLHESIDLGPDTASVMEPPDLHGTLCATLVAASANPKGGLGAAPACRLLPVKWTPGEEAPFPKSHFLDIVTFLRKRVSVVSSSWNIGHHAYWPAVICDAVKDAALNGGPDGKGVVWVWSAGNRNCPLDHTSDVEVPIEVASDGRARIVRHRAKEFKASFVGLPGVIHVGAISSLGQRCHYSNYGTGLTLVAPSSNRHLYDRMRVSGRYMMAPLGAAGLYPLGGTSAAAPLVAGVAALVRSANPALTALETVSILKRTADKNLDMRPYPSCSRPTDPEPDWDISPIAPFDSGKFRKIGDAEGTWSAWFGFGKVNARRAVAESIRRGRRASR